MITASSLIALVEARGAKEAAGQLLEVGAASDTAGEKIKSMAVGGLLVAGAAAIGFGAASVKMAADFEQSTNLLITSAGEVPQNIDLIRKGLLQMSVDTATSTDQLVKGMFNIESAGYHGADALKIEGAAARGAKVENADLAATTDVLTTAMHNYHEPASQAVDVMNSFRMSASMGKMHMDDLTGALRNVLPIASQAGVSLTGVEAAISTMSLAGDKGASAGTHLAQMLTYLLAPSSKAKSALKEVGLTTQEISDEMKVSLPGTVQMITDAVGEKFPAGSAKYIAALSAIVGGNKSMKAMLELSGISLKTFTDDAAQLAPTMKANSTAVDGWTTVQSNFNFKLDAAKNAVEALMISVGTKLLPVVGELADLVTPLISDFSDWVGKSNALSGAFDQIEAALHPVSDTILQVKASFAPLANIFHDARDSIRPFADTLNTFSDARDKIKPFTDALSGGLTDARDKIKPFTSALTDARDSVQPFTDSITKAKTAVNPFVALFKEWKPVIVETASTLEILAGDVETFVTGIVDAADKSGAFQSILQTVHDLLPDVDTFLVGVGSDVNSYLLPPLEDLTRNVGESVKNFSDWLNKSGTAKAAIHDLGFAVDVTARSLGVIVGWTSELVGWLNKDSSSAIDFKSAVVILGGAFVALKIAETVKGFGDMVSKLNEGDGIVKNLASSFKDKLGKAIDDLISKQFPNMKKAFDDFRGKADDVAASEEKVGTTAKEEMASGVEKGSTEAEGSLGGVEAQANASAGSVEGIGTAADAAEVQVATDTTLMDGEIKGVGTAATTAEGQVAAIGPAMKTSAAVGTGAFAGFAGSLVTLGIGAIVALEAYMLSDAWAAVVKSYGDPSYKPPSGPGGVNPRRYAAGTDNAAGGPSLVGERGAELVLGPRYGDLPQGSRVIPHAQTMSLLGGGNNQPIHVHIEVGGHEVLSYLIDHMGNAMMQQSILQYGGRRW